MKIAIGHSMDPWTEEAMTEIVTQCTEQLEGAIPQAGVVFACIESDHSMILQKIQEAWPGISMIGCSTDGELSNRLEFQEDSVSLMLFASDEVIIRTGIGRNLSEIGPTEGAKRAVALALDGIELEPSLCIVLPESLTVSGVQVVNAVQDVLGATVPIVGGTSGDQWAFENTYQFFGTEVLQDSLPVLVFSGDLKTSVGISSGWSTVGRKGVVTRSDGHVVYEIDNIPAIDFYKHYFGGHIIVGQEYPLGVIQEDPNGGQDDFYLRAPMQYDADSGTITFAGDVPEGSQVHLTEAGRQGILVACEESVQMAIEDYPKGETPTAALIISCAARKQLLGTRTHEEYRTLAEMLPPDLPTIGFYSYGEIAPLRGCNQSHFHNETFVTVLLGN